MDIIPVDDLSSCGLNPRAFVFSIRLEDEEEINKKDTFMSLLNVEYYTNSN